MKKLSMERILVRFLVIALVFILLPSVSFATEVTAWDGTTTTAVTPVETADGYTYTITTGAELAWVAEQVNEGITTFLGDTIILDDDIDLDNKNWTPIGDRSKQFEGVFEGNGKTISNLYITSGNESGTYYYVGLFGYVGASGTVKDVTLENVTVSDTFSFTLNGQFYLGSLVGFNVGTIENCHSFGTISKGSTSVYTSGFIGGLVGYLSNSTLENCSYTGEIFEDTTIDSLSVGGLVGYLSNSTLENCYSAVSSVTASGGTIFNYAGGLVGYLVDGTLENCYSVAESVIASGGTSTNYAGGLVARFNFTTMKNCYSAVGTVTASGESYNYAGGLVGYIFSNSALENCYSAADSVTASGGISMNYAGGLVGVLYSGAVEVENCYWLFVSEVVEDGFGYGSGTDCQSFNDTGELEDTTTLLKTLNDWVVGKEESNYFSWMIDSSSTYIYPVFGEMEDETTTFTIAFDSQGGTSVSDQTTDENGKLSNLPSTTRSDYTFKGWYTSATGGVEVTTDYQFSGNITVYAQWTATSSGTNVVGGECGTNLTWSLDLDTGVLTISGTGAMSDYVVGAPWSDYLDSISTVAISEGVTSIGAFAFRKCTNLDSITIPDTVSNIGAYAFENCSSLTSVILPSSLTSISQGMFGLCTNLTSLTIPNSVSSIGATAFSLCSKLSDVYYEGSQVEWASIEISSGNTNLSTATIHYSTSDSFSSYNISFDTQGGTVVSDQTTDENGKLSNLPSTTRSEYFFKGWYTSATGGIEVTTDYRFAGNITVYAQWYTTVVGGECGDNLTWSLNLDTGTLTISGSGDMSDFPIASLAPPWEEYSSYITTVEIGKNVTSIRSFAFMLQLNLTSVTIPVSVVSIGEMAFFGCFYLTDVYYAGTESDWNKVNIDSGNDTLADVTIHYNSTAPSTTYTISFSSGTGSGTMTSITGFSGNYTLPTCTFTPPTGYQFKAWSIDGTEYAVGEKYLVEANTAITAIWEEIPEESITTYTITFNSGTGTGSMTSVTGFSGSYTLPTCTFTPPTGYQFKAWSIGGVEYAVDKTYFVESDTAITAIWELENFSDDSTDSDTTDEEQADEESEETVEVQLSVRDLPIIKTMTTSTFSDMNDSTKWYYEAVKFVYDRGLMAGTGDGEFSPDTQTSRGMIVTVLHNLAGKPSGNGSVFTDVDTSDYFASAVDWASAVGIAGGVGGQRFAPDDDMTREELAVMLYAYEKLMNGSYSGPKNLPFTDTNSISFWAEEAISWCYVQGIVSGKDGGSFDPLGSATRAEVATMLRNFVNYATGTSTSSVEFTFYKIPGLSF